MSYFSDVCTVKRSYYTVFFYYVLLNFYNLWRFLLDGDIDFITHYKLVDPGKIESYARAFVVEDEDFDTVITAKV